MTIIKGAKSPIEGGYALLYSINYFKYDASRIQHFLPGSGQFQEGLSEPAKTLKYKPIVYGSTLGAPLSGADNPMDRIAQHLGNMRI